MLRCVNRDFVKSHLNGNEVVRTTDISDAFVIKCSGSIQRNNKTQEVTLWYLSEIDGYLYSIMDNGNGEVEDQLVDMAYEQNGNQLYVIFKDDNHVYRYDNVDRMMDSRGWILLSKELASYKINTFHSMAIHQGYDNELKWIFLDYSNKDE